MLYLEIKNTKLTVKQLCKYIKSLVDECDLEDPMTSETLARRNALDDILDYIYLDGREV